MIHVELKPEPPNFDEEVRKPGENALAWLLGKPLPHKRVRRRIRTTRTKKLRNIDDFAYWQNCLDELYDAYGGICAYYAFYIERATSPEVDHATPKRARVADKHAPSADHAVAKQEANQASAYEWSNFRLACGYANTCKGNWPDVLDPATIQDGWFQLDLLTLRVDPDPKLDPELRSKIEATIKRLKLREARALATRKRAMDRFRAGLDLSFLYKDHPFLAKELERQGITSREKLPTLPPEVIDRREEELILSE